VSFNCHPSFPIVARHMNGESPILFFHLKVRMMMDAGKQPSTNKGIELRSGVSPGNIDAFPIFALLFPLDSNAVSRIL